MRPGSRRLGYLFGAAARRAIHRMLYWAKRYVMKLIAPTPMMTQRSVRLASSPGGSGGSPERFAWMMYDARSLMSWSVRAAPPLAGILVDLGSPCCGSRPLVMMLMRNSGSSGLVTPFSVRSMGFKAGPTPPVSAAPWQEPHPAGP